MNIRIVVACLTLACSLGCQLPTAPNGGHAALTASGLSTSATGRQRAADPNHRLAPPCSAPAPLRWAAPQDREAGYIFVFHAGTDSQAVTAELAARHGFTPTFVYTSLPGFAAVVTEQALAAIRCDGRVQEVEYDVTVRIAGR